MRKYFKYNKLYPLYHRVADLVHIQKSIVLTVSLKTRLYLFFLILNTSVNKINHWNSKQTIITGLFLIPKLCLSLQKFQLGIVKINLGDFAKLKKLDKIKSESFLKITGYTLKFSIRK